ncbi:MAG: dihydropteroate synthase [Francisellaceae bacterium]
MVQVVLGLGSNIGRKLDYLRQAVKCLEQEPSIELEKISAVYESAALLPPDAPGDWNRNFYNIAVLIETDLSAEALLVCVQKIECDIGRPPTHAYWSPRVIDIDILCYGDKSMETVNLSIPHRYLLKRAFALVPLLEVMPKWRHPLVDIDLHRHAKSLDKIEVAPFCIDGSKIMAIINLSEDSFSGGGVSKTDDVLAIVDQAIKEGAEVIDIGAESTKPNATHKSAEEVWALLEPCLLRVNDYFKAASFSSFIDISIDTYHEKVVKNVCQFSCVTMINDVYGSQRRQIASYLKGSAIKYVYMHQLGSAGGHYLDVCGDSIKDVLDYGISVRDELIDLGLEASQLVYDIGIGFGKYSFQVKSLLAALPEIKKTLGLALLVGHSRKNSAMPALASADHYAKDLATALLSCQLISSGVDYLRVHNVQASAIARAMMR